MMTELFTPAKIGNCVIPNRLIVPAMVMNLCTEDGMITERYIKYIEEKAKGGWGMVITEDYAVNENAKGYKFIPGLYNDEQIEGNRKLTETVHKYDTKLFCQMYHPGRQSKHDVNGNVQPLAPSAIKDPFCMDLPREITVDEIHQIVKDFGSTAKRAKAAGFDGIEIHAAHGYLISEFLSPFTNKRVDEYGGCFENRTRILDEVYACIRENVGKDFPVQVRISANEYLLGGRTEADTYELVRHLDELGVDAIHVSNGMYASPVIRQIIAPMYTEHAFNIDTAEQVKKLVSCPVIVTNRINDPKMADTILKMGKADFIGMGRGSLADPYLPAKAKAGQFENIRYCIGCLQGCEAIPASAASMRIPWRRPRIPRRSWSSAEVPQASLRRRLQLRSATMSLYLRPVPGSADSSAARPSRPEKASSPHSYPHCARASSISRSRSKWA